MMQAASGDNEISRTLLQVVQKGGFLEKSPPGPCRQICNSMAGQNVTLVVGGKKSARQERSLTHLHPVFVFFACIKWERPSMHREVINTWIPPFQFISAGSLSDLLIFVYEVSTHARFSDSAGLFSNSHITLLSTWPSPSVHGVGTRKKVISELNGLPMLPPVNKTSPRPIRYRSRRMTQNRRLL
jgi:hypothetical protein